MNYEEIMARIQKGDSAEDIVKEFNANVRKAQEAVAAQEAAKKADDAKSKKLDEIAMAIAHALNEYVALAGLDCEKLRGVEVRELLDKFLPVLDSLKSIEVYTTKATPKSIADADREIAKWLKSLGW